MAWLLLTDGAGEDVLLNLSCVSRVQNSPAGVSFTFSDGLVKTYVGVDWTAVVNATADTWGGHA